MEKQVTLGSFAPAQGKAATAVGVHPGCWWKRCKAGAQKFFEKI